MRIAKIMQSLSKVLNKQNINHRIKIQTEISNIKSEVYDLYDTEVIILMDLKENNVKLKENNVKLNEI